MLGTKDAWFMSCLSHRPSEPAYYIEDFRISVQCPIALQRLQLLDLQTPHLAHSAQQFFTSPIELLQRKVLI